MGSKHFQNRARREWWSVHVEAWRRSGLSQRRYCAQHRLDKKTFARWLMVVGDAKALQHKERRERPRPDKKLSKDRRSKAVQAFWAMHVEAMTWSGMSVRDYAAAHRISPHSLRRWRALVETGEVEIDWRAHLHPSARPKISTSASDSAKDRSTKDDLTTALTADLAPSDRKPRRTFSDEEKRSIVRETEQPGATVSQVARDHGIVTSLLFRWRAELGFGRVTAAKLAAVMLADGQCGGSSAALVLHDLLQPPDDTTIVELDDGRRVFVPIGSDPEAVRRHVADRETTR